MRVDIFNLHYIKPLGVTSRENSLPLRGSKKAEYLMGGVPISIGNITLKAL